MSGKGQKGDFWIAGNVLCLNLDGGYMGAGIIKKIYGAIDYKQMHSSLYYNSIF